MGDDGKKKTWITTKKDGVYIRETSRGEEVFYASFRRAGKRIFAKIGVKDSIMEDGQKLTLAVAAQILSDYERGKVDTPAERRAEERKVKWTFDNLWKAWKADPENAGKRGTDKADQRYRKHLSADSEDVKGRPKDAPPPLGNREPSELKPLDLDRLRLYLAKDHAKATTVSVLGLIRRIERYGASKNLCAGLPFPIILKGKTLGREPEMKKAPTDEQVEAYIKTCEEWPDEQAGHFQLFIALTGIRRGSVRSLKWEDVDLDNHTAVLKDSKTGDVQIVLSDDAVELLRKHPKTTGEDGEVIPYVFTGSDPDGKRSQRQVDRLPREIADAAGLPADLDPCHSFRRRLATKVEGAFGIATAMKAGGWKSPAMVINYTATSNQTLRDAANLLGRKTADNGK